MSQHPPPPQSSKIFISYRRDDTAGHAGRLYDRLATHFGETQVFMDIERIEAGVDFVEAIREAVGSCVALIVLIGREWLDTANENGRRLDDPNDFVRLEVGVALERGVRVIPVLVQGAQMPRSQSLPESLAGLSRRHAVELSDTRWKRDVDELIATLDRALARQRDEQLKAAEAEERRRAADAERQRREAEAAEARRREAEEAEARQREAEEARMREAEAERQRREVEAAEVQRREAEDAGAKRREAEAVEAARREREAAARREEEQRHERREAEARREEESRREQAAEVERQRERAAEAERQRERAADEERRARATAAEAARRREEERQPAGLFADYDAPASEGRRTLPLVLGGLAVAAVGVAVVIFLITRPSATTNEKSDLTASAASNETTTAPTAQTPATDDGTTAATVNAADPHSKATATPRANLTEPAGKDARPVAEVKEQVVEVKERPTATPPPPAPKPVVVSDDEPPSPRPMLPPKSRAPISAGVLNGKAISKPAPPYPAVAKAARASGTVVVQITVDESGRVVSASAVSGHPLLRQAAVQAAYGARFSPTLLSGQAVRVTGTISYNFNLQ